MVPKKNKLNLSPQQIKYLKSKLNVKKIEDIDVAVFKELKERFKKLKDTRQKGKVVYKIWDVVMTTIIANFAEVYDWEDIVDFVENHYKWFKTFLQMTGGVPTAQTYENIFAIIDSTELENILIDFYKYIVNPKNCENDLINIDGRVDKGSARNKTEYSDKEKPLNVLNAYSNKHGMCFGSVQIDCKSNEIPAVQDIIKKLNIKNCTLTWDALNTQVNNVAAVVKADGDYVVPIKGNQQLFYNDLIDFFDETKLECIIAGQLNSAYMKEIEKSHSSVITYEYFQTTDVKWYSDIQKWENCNSFGLVKKTISKGDIETVEFRYYISSLFINIKDFSNAIRNHWSVENKLHWHLDVTFREDKNTTKNKNALMNKQLVNKFSLGVLNKVKSFYNKSLIKIRRNMSQDFEGFFNELLCYLIISD